MHPEKVNRLILLGASCGEIASTPPSPEIPKFATGLLNKYVNKIPLTPQELKTIVALPLGSAWIKLHPNYLETIPANTQPKDIIPIPSYTYQQQAEIAKKWMATNWSGICDEITKVSNPTLIITENHDNNMPSANYLVICRKNP